MKQQLQQLQPEEKLLLTIIKKNYSQAKKLIEVNDIDWQIFIGLVNEHRISSIMYTCIINNLSEVCPQKFLTICKINVLQRIAENKYRQRELKTLGKLFEERNIPMMALKGFTLDPELTLLREFYDIDVLIPENMIISVIDYLTEKGYSYQGSFMISIKEKNDIYGQLKWNNQYQYKCPSSPFVIEIHTNLFERDRIRLENLTFLLDQVDLFWERKRWDDNFLCYFPCHEASLALLCLHTSLKRSPAENKMLLRHSLDMEILVKNGIDKNYFLSLCRTWRISYHICFAFKLHEMIMETSYESFYTPLLYELNKRERLLMKTHLSCVKDLHSSSSWGIFRYRLLMPFVIGGGIKKSIIWYLECIFPTRVKQEFDFGIKRESPFIFLTYLINPPRWIWRKVIKPLINGNS
ncbi:MAG: nucleotidyltransferase family protein [Spirochaetaceae bacterium]|nr:nucleotidyltransferase family protein [Spirochaetaceae bacterium]